MQTGTVIVVLSRGMFGSCLVVIKLGMTPGVMSTF